MGTGTVWVLNLDAELELASRGRYRPTARVAELVRHHRAPLEALLPRGDIVLDAAAPDAYMGLRGRAYCPTPSALEALARVGAIADAAPSFEVLRAVNDRAFAHSLGATLPSEAFLTSESALDSYLRDAEELEGGFLIKKRWSMSGRGHRRVGRALGEAERKHVRALLREDGGFLVEPFVAIEREASMHGWIDEHGALNLGVPCIQLTDAHRAFRGARRAAPGDLEPDEERALHDAVGRAGVALRGAGYFGPFGVDAFRYATSSSERIFRARSELNARMTMALPLGMSVPP